MKEARQYGGTPSTPDHLESDPQPLVCVIVIHYGDWQQTERCLSSLWSLRYRNYTVLIVDNGGTSNSHRPGACFAAADILVNAHNPGYAAGCNRGICRVKERKPDYVWLLNTDTEVEPDSLTAMVRLSEADRTIGAVGSVILNPDPERSIQAWGGGKISCLTGLPRHARRGGRRRLDYLCGASLLLRCKALDQVGLLDSGFFLYWEDTDICFRFRAQGWKLSVAADSRIVHKGSGSTGFQSAFYDYHFTASSVRFFRVHARFWFLPLAVSVAGRLARRILSGRPENARAVWRGLRSAMTGDISLHSKL